MSNVALLREQIARLQARVDELEGEPRSSRRTMLRLTGAAVVGGAAVLAAGGHAGAAVGTMQYGTVNNAGTSNTYLTSAADPTLTIINSGASTGVYAATTGAGTAVYARISSPNTDSYATWARIDGQNYGYPLVCTGGQSHIRLGAYGTAFDETLLRYNGEIANYTTKGLIACVAGGTPGTWRVLAAEASAGALFPIPPARVYDSRKPGPPVPITSGQNRTVATKDGHNVNTWAVIDTDVVPVGATAIAYNLTVVNTVGASGWLAVNVGGNTVVGASAINWFGNGQVLANASTVKLDNSRQVTVICGGAGAGCNFIIDVVGYYR